MAAALRVREIYRSIQGESSFAGWPCAFVRTAGCDIRCVYCDEPHAFGPGERMEIDVVLTRIAELGVELVEVTGGEPLLQPSTFTLVSRLLDAGYRVLVETGGHRDISALDPRAHVIMDVKTPGSGMVEHVDWKNLERLRPGDEVKFVLADRADYLWARDVIRDHALERRIVVHLSPVHGALDPRELSAWMLEDRLRARLNLQLHKYIWGPNATGV
jgi:7-carboxy-7-deazaguanine synthase